MSSKICTCIYCGKRFDRMILPRHLEVNHLSELPEGFTPLQVAYHIANKKPLNYKNKCRICGEPTDWDEVKGRYNLLCNKKSCHEAWAKRMKSNMGSAMGSNRPTTTPEGLEKMLAARHISGEYKFQDGSIKTYTGSYEKKALEFFDKVLNCKSEDIQAPGPILQYNFEGKLRYYISDFYYIPYNLIIEVKDGGNNPNKNPSLDITRKKKIAKEKYIIENTDYNYIRLTDNDFSQILSVFADLKEHLLLDDHSKVIHVNEDFTTFGAIPMNGGTKDGVVVVNYLQNNVFSGCGNKEPEYAVADDIELHNLITRSEWDKLSTESAKFLENCKYSTYWVKCDRDKVLKIFSENINKEVDKNFIYETVFGHKPITADQIEFEENCIAYKDHYAQLKEITDSVKNYILKGDING